MLCAHCALITLTSPPASHHPIGYVPMQIPMHTSMHMYRHACAHVLAHVYAYGTRLLRPLYHHQPHVHLASIGCSPAQQSELKATQAARLCVDIHAGMYAGMCVDTCAGMSVALSIDMPGDLCIRTCACMCACMCVGMYVDRRH